MTEALRDESEKLIRSWMQHDTAHLRDYLVASVEDPRLNLQSVLSRHFLVRALAGQRFNMLMEQEYRFAAVMNWLAKLLPRIGDAEELEAVLYGLRKGSDNAEGIPIPHYVGQIFSSLPAKADGAIIPNYIEAALVGSRIENGRGRLDEVSLDTLSGSWKQVLGSADPVSPHLPSHVTHQSSKGSVAEDHPSPTVSVIEPACGSANDYRFLERYGIAQRVDYSGFDLCAKNIENARILFPHARFELGNVFEIAAPDKAFDFCFVHDLFEHLSMEGIARAVEEICRVTKRGICAGFFNMDEIPESVARPMDDYHWNTLSMERMAELFVKHGFTAQVLHIGTFLRKHVGCDETHNPNAYTFWLRPA